MPDPDHQLPFQAHVELLQVFIEHRIAVVERIQNLLAAQQDRSLPGLEFEDCFFTQPGVPHKQLALRGQLQQAHWADGFKPRDMPGIPNEMFDPADMMARAINVWRHTRWPGRNGRLRYAQTLFNLYVVRCLALLDMRVCDAGPAAAGQRLAVLQDVLDLLWKSSPADQPVLVRDVRWLVPVAQSPTTDDLAPYFEATRRFEECLTEADRLEIHKASVLMAGGHLRSQLRHFTMNGKALGDADLTLSTRASNALDCAMTIQHLAPLLAAYERAIDAGDAAARHVLAGIICQGLSADPELYVNRLDLLGAYSMIEPLFVAMDATQASLTPMGQRHVLLVQQYGKLILRLAQPLHEDCPQFRPAGGSYSPYGVMYGFSANILEHMALKAMQPDAESRFSLEDVFADDGNGAARLAWVSGWRKLPHVPQEVLKLYEYPQAFAEEIFGRIEQALACCVSGACAPVRTGKLFIDRADIAALPARYLLSSDPQLVTAGKAQPCSQERFSADRQEGMYLVSCRTQGGWLAVSKNVLTELLGIGLDASIEGLPDQGRKALEIMYPQVVSWVSQ